MSYKFRDEEWIVKHHNPVDYKCKSWPVYFTLVITYNTFSMSIEFTLICECQCKLYVF